MIPKALFFIFGTVLVGMVCATTPVLAQVTLSPTGSAPRAANDQDVKTLKAVDKRYQSATSVTMKVQRTTVLSVLGKEKTSKGELVLSKGRMRMELNEPNRSVIVIDGKNLWVADYPDPDFKSAAVQVMKGEINSKKGLEQSFVRLLTHGGILKQFMVSGVTESDNRLTYFLLPKQHTFEFRRARLILSEDRKSIAELIYWDENDNETRMTFSNIRFNKKVPTDTFRFVPPKDADITTL